MNSTANVTIESLIQKLKEFFKDKEMNDLTKLFGYALHGMREYKRNGLPENKESDEFKKSIGLFANPDKPAVDLLYTNNMLAFMSVYETLKDNNIDLFKKCVVQLPEVLQNIKNEMEAMQIDPDSNHKKNYLVVKDYVTQLETLVAADIKSLESSQVLGHKK